MSDRLLSPEDDLAIRALYARYSHAIACADFEGWSRCFTPEGTFTNRLRTVRGRGALAEYASGWAADRRSRYWFDNILLEPASEGARGSCYLLLLTVGATGEAPVVSLTGVYEDSLVLLDGEWLFSSRRVMRDE